MNPRTVKMIAPDPQTGALREIFPWSGIEIDAMQPRFLTQGLDSAVWTSVPGVQAIDVWGSWTSQWAPQEIKARRMLTGRSLAQLIDDFDQTDVMTDGSQDTADRLAEAIVRGWIMDELEQRDPVAFDAWMQTTEGSPRRFFMTPVYTMERKLCDAKPGSPMPDEIWTGVCAFHAADETEANRKASRWARHQGISQRSVRLRLATEHEATHWLHDEWMDLS